MNTAREYYQVVTKDRLFYSLRHNTLDDAIEYMAFLRSETEPYGTYVYEIIYVVETVTEEIVSV